jgi:hypothetical protein|nr:MAG TPA: hypothetical protein [Caudoviricetes sp.]
MHTIISRPGSENRNETINAIKAMVRNSEAIEVLDCLDDGILTLGLTLDGIWFAHYVNAGHHKVKLSEDSSEIKEAYGFWKVIHQAFNSKN